MTLRQDLLTAIMPHVVFDGWSPRAFAAAISDLNTADAEAKLACPRGAVDLAVDYHRAGDAQMLAAVAGAEMGEMRYSEKVAYAIWQRLALTDREIVRRGSVLFALPHHAAEGAGLIWETADAIWRALGDTSDDVNWYTKRATLSAVYGSVVLYWLGDDSPDGQATKDFIDRRIENVMQFEKMKAQMRGNKFLSAFTSPLAKLTAGIKAPGQARDDVPGQWRDKL